MAGKDVATVPPSPRAHPTRTPRKRERRGWGEGGLYQSTTTVHDRKTGRTYKYSYWTAAVYIEGPDGRSKKVRVKRRKKSDAREALKELLRQKENGVVIDREMTVAKYLSYWLDEVVAGSGKVSPQTVDAYRRQIRNWVVPFLGHIKLGKLRYEHVQPWVNGLHARGLARASIREAFSRLDKALRHAIALQRLDHNPCDEVLLSKTERKTPDALTAAEARQLLVTSREDRLYALLYVAVIYGLRISEALNLRWDDVGEDGFRITKSKTEDGDRFQPFWLSAADVLATHRAAQEAERDSAGDGWRENGLVFTDEHGRQLKDAYVRRWLQQRLKAAQVPHKCQQCGQERKCSGSVRRFHALRGTAVNLLDEAGIQRDDTSLIVGHANRAITDEHYSDADRKRRAIKVPHHPLADLDTDLS